MTMTVDGVNDRSPLDKERTLTLRKISAEHCLEAGGPHGPDHSERVYYMALALGRKMNARLDILAAAALLHDIGRRHETESRGKICHAEKSAELAVNILKELRFSDQDIDKITDCIRCHRFRGRKKPESMEAKILFDADKLDSIGAIGIGRAFLFAGQIGACLHNAEIDHTTTDSYSREDSAYREFQVKMSKVRDRMLTPSGRELARQRHKFMEVFFDELNREMYGTGRAV